MAGRGEDLGEVIDRANPALRETDKVLKILADQNQQLASLADNGAASLEPLARERQHITSFMANANIAAEATAERKVELERQLELFPRFLRELRLTMKDLRGVTDNATPVFRDTGAVAKAWGEVQLTPTSFLVNEKGEIVKRYVGEPDFNELHALIEKLLAEG